MSLTLMMKTGSRIIWENRSGRIRRPRRRGRELLQHGPFSGEFEQTWMMQGIEVLLWIGHQSLRLASPNHVGSCLSLRAFRRTRLPTSTSDRI